jgi:hypothetical protein
MELLTSKEVQKILKCSLPWIYKAAEEGILPCVRWQGLGEEGRRKKSMVRFEVEAIRGFIEQHRQKST